MESTFASTDAEFEITSDLTGLGWIAFKLRSGERSCECRASWLYHSALDDLVEAAIEMANGASSASSFMIQEPGSYSWIFSQTQQCLHLHVFLNEGRLYGREGADYGALIFEEKIPTRNFCLALVHSMTHLIEKWGFELYKEKWGRPFPVDRFKELRLLVSQ